MKVIIINSQSFQLLMDKIIRIEKFMETKQMQETIEPITWVKIIKGKEASHERR